MATKTTSFSSGNCRPRIVFVLPALSAGGAERVLITLMNELGSDLYERIFLAVNEDGELRHLISPDIPFHSLGKGRSFVRSFPSLSRKLKELRPDIVVSTMAHMNFAVLLLKPFFPGTRFIVREAITPTYFDQKPFAIKSFIYCSYRLLYPRADLVISPAQKIIDEFRDVFKIDIKNHVLLPNPVDVDRIRGGDEGGKDCLIRCENTVHYVCAGRLVHQKGFDRLIELLPALKMPHDWHLTILGEGEQRKTLEQMIKENELGDKVTLAGYTASPWPVIASADAFLMPSRHEGLPNAVLEALACGTPVIATRSSGGIKEIAAHTEAGSVTVVDDMDEFIKAMAKIAPHPASDMRPSLLPECYTKKAIVERFSRLLVR